MNESERSELEFLKQRHEQMSQELAALAKQLQSLEAKLTQKIASPAASSAPTQPTVPSAKISPAPAPSTQIPTPKPAVAVPPVITSIQPPPLPTTKIAAAPQVKEAPVMTQAAHVPTASPELATASAASPPIPPIPSLAKRSGGAPGAKPRERSFEMRLGTFWLPLIGIVLLVTGLVFFGNYAYQNFIVRLGPWGKVSLLYLASFTLLGLGWWWQRKHVKESLRNYGQVLFAGGLAMVYFTTYAAHHFPHLKVIPSPVLDGALLLGWAGYMVWIADRRKSQVLALFAVLLAYYTAVITHVGQFTLYSNLILTLAAVFFLVRNRWAALSFISLAASYASYGYWRFFNGTDWHWASIDQGLWAGAYFLMSYWAVFTAAVFLSRDEKFAGANRSCFLTLNNGAFFTMFLLTMFQVHHGGFWKFSLIFGLVLLALSELSRRLLPGEPLSANSYLTQGLLLGTIGLISNPHLAGLNLALVLAAESVTLLLAGHQRKNLVMLIGAYGSAALAVGWGMDGMLQHEPHGLWLGVGLGIIMLANALLVDREYRAATQALLRPQVSYFVVLALSIWFVVTYNNTDHPDLPLALAIQGVLFISSIYLVRVREISIWGQAYLMGAQLLWIYQVLSGSNSPKWWNTLGIMAVSIGISQWWRRQKQINLKPAVDPATPGLVIIPVLAKPAVLLAATYVAIGLTGGWEPLVWPTLDWQHTWVPMLIAILLFAEAIGTRRAAARPDDDIRVAPAFATMLGLITWLALSWHHTPKETFPLVLAAEGIVLTLSYYLLRSPEISLLSQGYLLIALAAWVLPVLDGAAPPRFWNPLLLIAMILGLSHWWQKQKVLLLHSETRQAWQGVYAAGIIAILYYWLSLELNPSPWMAVSTLLAIGITAYGVFTRSWLLAAFGQFFVLVSGLQFIRLLAQGKPHWGYALVPLTGLLLLSWSVAKWFQQKPDATEKVSAPLFQIALVYRWAALAMSLWWIGKYIPDREHVWVLIGLSLVIFLVAGWRRNGEALLFAAVFAISGVALFWQPHQDLGRIYLPNFIALLALLFQQRLARRWPERFQIDPRIQGALIIVGGLSIWLFVSDWVVELTRQTGYQGSYLTASYSALGLIFFTSGILLSERVYRWLGLGILAFCLARVMVIDVWKLELLYKVLSFMALGIVLLVLGFIYNKYQEKIKEWL